MLRLVNHQYRAAFSLMVAQQKLVQRVRENFEAVRSNGIVNFKFVTDRCQQLDSTERGVQHDRDVGIWGQLLEKASVEGGLTGAHLTCQHDKSTATAYTVQQVRKRIPMARAHE